MSKDQKVKIDTLNEYRTEADALGRPVMVKRSRKRTSDVDVIDFEGWSVRATKSGNPVWFQPEYRAPRSAQRKKVFALLKLLFETDRPVSVLAEEVGLTFNVAGAVCRAAVEAGLPVKKRALGRPKKI